MTTTTEVIDMTPPMLKSAEGRALVHEANTRLSDAICNVAHMVALHLDDMEHETGLERMSAFAAVKLAITRWHEAGSDFAFTLGGTNPETRERYNFKPDVEDGLRPVVLTLSPAAAVVIANMVGAKCFADLRFSIESALFSCGRVGDTPGSVDLELHHVCDTVRKRGFQPQDSGEDF